MSSFPRSSKHSAGARCAIRSRASIATCSMERRKGAADFRGFESASPRYWRPVANLWSKGRTRPVALSNRSRIHRCLFWLPVRRGHRGACASAKFGAATEALLRLRTIANDAKPSIALTTSSILSRVESLFAHTPELQTIDLLASDKVAISLARDWRDPAVTGNSLALLQYYVGLPPRREA